MLSILLTVPTLKWFHMRNAVSQACVLLPYLFNILLEMVMREALEGYRGGLHTGGGIVSNLRYVDDIIQDLVNHVNQISKMYDVQISVDKTKTMEIDGQHCGIFIDNKAVEKVDKFCYLGSLITDDVDCTKQIWSRLGRGQGVCASLKNIWNSHNIHITTKIQLLKAFIWPVATYGRESWVIKKADEQCIQAFEVKGLRQTLRVSRTAKKTNDWVLEKAGVTAALLTDVKRRKLRYFGHVIRKPGNCLEKRYNTRDSAGKQKKRKTSDIMA